MSVRYALLLGVALALTVAEPADATVTTWREQGALGGPATVTNYFARVCAATNGTSAVVGAPAAANAGALPNVGAVRVFSAVGANWVLTQTLAPSDLPADASFGTSCAMTDDHLVIGAHGYSGPVSIDPADPQPPGAAYVYARRSGAWVLEQKLSASDSAPSNGFGISVAIDASTILVGAESAGTSLQGAAYVFARTASGWSAPQKLTASNSNPVDAFGSSVAVDGATIAVGARLRINGRGGVYVFSGTGARWIETQMLTASDSALYDNLGVSIALRGDNLVAGAPRKNSFTGGAYLFGRTSGTWTERKQLEPPAPLAGDRFGDSVALDGDILFVGATGKKPMGSVLVFRARTWELVGDIAPPLVTSGFGRALGASGTTLVAASWDQAFAFRNSRARGDACAKASECITDFCVDGVCCDTACGGSDPSDCKACTHALGASEDGVCSAALPTLTCRPAKSDCDAPERCDGVTMSCPTDSLVLNGATCASGTCVNGACVPPAAAPPTDAKEDDPSSAPPSSNGGCRISDRASWPVPILGASLVAAIFLERRRRR